MDFDLKAQSWDTDSKIERAKVIANEIKRTINLDTAWNALEFGAGTGLVSLNLIDEFDTITMIDTSHKMIEVLKDKISSLELKKVRAVNAPIESLLAKNERFQIIYTSMVLHHLIDIPDIISKFAALLRPNGFLCIIDLMKEDGSFHGNNPDFTGHHGFDPDELEKVLVSNHCRNVAWHEFYKETRIVNNETKEYSFFILTGKLE